MPPVAHYQTLPPEGQPPGLAWRSYSHPTRPTHLPHTGTHDPTPGESTGTTGAVELFPCLACAHKPRCREVKTRTGLRRRRHDGKSDGIALPASFFFFPFFFFFPLEGRTGHLASFQPDQPAIIRCLHRTLPSEDGNSTGQRSELRLLNKIRVSLRQGRGGTLPAAHKLALCFFVFSFCARGV